MTHLLLKNETEIKCTSFK